MTNRKSQVTLHQNLPVLQVAEPFLLDILLADPVTAPYILVRLSDLVAIVEPKRVDTLLARLFKLKHTPKVLEQ
ncbi:MAG: hypothetical protein Q7O66_13855 [Dehalococcoidia bacterium]|nr:hypothetical protein [Dehalococcoidia bacterium]